MAFPSERIRAGSVGAGSARGDGVEVDPTTGVRQSSAASARPGAFDLTQERRVDDPVPERLDEGHVGRAQRAAASPGPPSRPGSARPRGAASPWSTQARCITPWTVGFESSAANYVRAVQRCERQRGEPNSRGRPTQIGGQPFGERAFVGPGDRQDARLVVGRGDPTEPEHTPDAVADLPRHAGRERPRVGGIGRRHQLDQHAELVAAPEHRERPDVLDREIGCELVDAPRAGLVHRGRQIMAAAAIRARRGAPRRRRRRDRRGAPGGRATGRGQVAARSSRSASAYQSRRWCSDGAFTGSARLRSSASASGSRP